MPRYKFILLVLLVGSCKMSEHREYGSDFHTVEKHLLKIEDLREASGLAASTVNKDILYSINDSGNKPIIYLLDYNGNDKGEIGLKGVANRDWEDITIGPGPENGASYIYVAEIGDNLAQYDVKYIYRFKEKKYHIDQKISDIVAGFDSISFIFPDGRRDAEVLLVEPQTKDLYIFSKREDTVGIYLARYPQSIDSVITLEKVGRLATKNVVAGSISTDGTEVLIKTYDTVMYWSKSKDERAYDVISKNAPKFLPYEIEPQGESMTWHPKGDGYFTLSEEPRGIESSLYFYKRNK